MDVSVEVGRIVLMPQRKKTRRGKVVADPVTGLAWCSGLIFDPPTGEGE
jgi:hypothetical protein